MRKVSKTKQQVPGILTTASSTMQPVCPGSITIFGSDDDVRRWRHVGAEQGLTDDLNIAVFLITFYEKHKDAVTSATCSWCKASLSLTCATNSHSSQFRGNGSAQGPFLHRTSENNCTFARQSQCREVLESSKQSLTNGCSENAASHSDSDEMLPHTHSDSDEMVVHTHSDSDQMLPHTHSAEKSSDLEDAKTVPLHRNYSQTSPDADELQRNGKNLKPPSLHRHTEDFKCSVSQHPIQLRNGKFRLKRVTRQRAEAVINGQNSRLRKLNNSHKQKSNKGKEQTFPCGACDAMFKKHHNLKQHVLSSHKDQSTFLCTLCGKSCSDSETLETHMHSHHCCPACSVTFNSDVRLKHHVHTQHPGVKPHCCEKCGKSYTSRQSLSYHKQKEHADRSQPTDGILCSNADGRYQCQACNALFHRQTLLKMHVSLYHSEIPFLCSVCGKPCIDPKELSAHMVTHAPFQCLVCDAKFAHNTKYTTHMRKQHPGVKAHKCLYCDMAFDTRKWLAVHALKHSGERPHLCPECGKSFTEAQVLQRHRLAMHQAARPYSCSQCSKTFKTSSALAYHRRSHSAVKPYLCDECGKTFPCARALSAHKIKCKALDQRDEQEGFEVNGFGDIPVSGNVVDLDSDRRPFKCQDCGAAFKGEQWLYRHQVNKPAACSKKFTCEFCPRVFKDNRNFVRHVRIHTGEKPFKCQECKSNFTTRSDLYRHSRTHSGVKPYACSECQLCFRFRCDLTTHLRTHNGETPYQCLYCDLAFISASQRLQHVRSKHKSVVHVNNVRKLCEKSALMNFGEDVVQTFSSGVNNL